MLDRLRNFLAGLGPGPRPQPRFELDDPRLSAAALLVHCMAVDGLVSDGERAKLQAVLAAHFKLGGADLDLLVEQAMQAEAEAVDLYRFTSVLKRQLSEEERVRLVERLWEMAFADGQSDELEDNLVWRVAELLAVDRQSRLAGKLAVLHNSQRGGGAAG